MNTKPSITAAQLAKFQKDYLIALEAKKYNNELATYKLNMPNNYLELVARIRALISVSQSALENISELKGEYCGALDVVYTLDVAQALIPSEEFELLDKLNGSDS